MTIKRSPKDRSMIGSNNNGRVSSLPHCELKIADIEKGQTKVEGNYCQNCGKYTMFLIEKYSHKLCPDCANNPSVLEIFKRREEMAKLENKNDEGKKCDQCGEKKNDVRFRRTDHLYLNLCEDCLKKLTEYKGK